MILQELWEKWLNFIYFPLGGIPIWPSRQQVDKGMPESF